MKLFRPHPPDSMRSTDAVFEPAPDLQEWIHSTFISPDGTLSNPAHEHLRDAKILCLWTNRPNTRASKTIVATAEVFSPQGSAWTRGRQEYQILNWFGDIPDFILTFWADFAFEANDATFCATAEHELYHCAQAENEYGLKYKRDGSPMYALRGHDTEEFIGVVARYGAQAAGDSVVQMVEAAKQVPLFSGSAIAQACGTCAMAARR
jgi:hypothetical protein